MPNIYRFGRYLMARHCLGQAKLVTAVSPYLCNAVQKYCNVPIAVVQNPLPDFLLTQEYDKYSNKIDENNKTDQYRIAMVINGWNALKNPKPAIIAFNRLYVTDYPNLELHIFGSGYGPGEQAEFWANNNNFKCGIHFHGYTPHCVLLEKLRAMDLMLHPALEESCPMGIAEALALGLPVIGGESSGGVPWVIGDGGLTTDVSSPLAIEAALKSLISNAELLHTLSINAIRRAKAVFSANVVANMYEIQYNHALDK